MSVITWLRATWSAIKLTTRIITTSILVILIKCADLHLRKGVLQSGALYHLKSDRQHLASGHWICDKTDHKNDYDTHFADINQMREFAS